MDGDDITYETVNDIQFQVIIDFCYVSNKSATK